MLSLQKIFRHKSREIRAQTHIIFQGFHIHSMTDGDQTTSFTVCKTEVPNGNDIMMDDIKQDESSQKMVEIPLKDSQYD